MGAGIRPEQFDRAAAKAAGYTDAEIDAFLQSQIGPRRDLVPSSAPAPTPPAAPTPRPGLLRRTADAAVGLGKAAVTDPIGTAKMIGRGVAQSGADLAALSNPTTAGANLQRMFVEDGFSPGQTIARAGNAASLLLAPVGRAAGLGLGTLAAADVATGAALGAASTPQDRGVGALLGGGLSLLTNAGQFRQAARGMGSVVDFGDATRGMTDGLMPQNVPSRPLARQPGTVPITSAAGEVASTLDDLARQLPKDASPGAQPLPLRGRGRRVPVSETVRSGVADDVLAGEIAAGRAQAQRSTVAMAGPERVVPETPIDDVVNAIVPREAAESLTRSAADAVVPPNPSPALGTARTFPEGYTTGALYDDFVREAQGGIADDVARAFDAPNPAPAPRASEAFPEGFQTPDQAPTARAVPKTRDTPPPLTPRASATPGDTPRAPTPRTTSPAPATVSQDVTDILPASVRREATGELGAAPEVPPAPAAAAAADEPRAAEAPAAVPSARPDLPPNRDGAVNWRTWFDQDAPGAQSVEARLQALATPERVQAARGYESMQATYARSLAAVKELTDDNGLTTIDPKKLRAFVERHGEAGVPALRKIAVDNANVAAQAAKVLNDPSASADDVLRATQVLESATKQTDDLLGTIVSEQARVGRSLNALKIQAKLTTDPDLWLVHAKRALGDQPMTDDIMAQVRKLANDAATACGG